MDFGLPGLEFDRECKAMLESVVSCQRKHVVFSLTDNFSRLQIDSYEPRIPLGSGQIPSNNNNSNNNSSSTTIVSILSVLPDEILFHIMAFMDARTLSTMSAICSTWASLLSDDQQQKTTGGYSLWEHLCRVEFPQRTVHSAYNKGAGVLVLGFTTLKPFLASIFGSCRKYFIERKKFEAFALRTLPANDCRYVMYNFTSPSSSLKKDAVAFIAWCSQDAPVKNRMSYASFVLPLSRSYLPYTVVQATDHTELLIFDRVMWIVNRGRTTTTTTY